MANCTDCQTTYQAYLSDLPSEWRVQIADLMCKVVADVNSEITCAEIKACETVTSLSNFTFDDGELAITYKDEKGISFLRTVDIDTATGDDFIQNQTAVLQTGQFRISGTGTAAAFAVTGNLPPTNGIYASATDELAFATAGNEVFRITDIGKVITDGQPDNAVAAGIQTSSVIPHNDNASSIGALTKRWNTIHSDTYRGQSYIRFVMGLDDIAQFQISTHNLIIGDDVATDIPVALLALNSVEKGFLPPRMTTAERTAIAAIEGLMVYDTDLQKLCIYTTAWETITSS